MGHFGKVKGRHKLIGIDIPGRPRAVLLCLLRQEDSGRDAYYVLAERDGASPLKWRSMVRDNSARRLKDEFIGNIVESRDVDELDVEMILFCAAEVSKA